MDVERFQAREGLEPSDWQQVAAVGAGVTEICIHAGGDSRVLHVIWVEEAVHVLHRFNSRTRKTAAVALEFARTRWRALVAYRRRTP